MSQDDISCLPILNVYSLWDNILIYTQGEEALIAERIPTNSKRIYYVYDLDWHNNGISYEKNIELFRSADYLLCRCMDHADKIEQYCGRRPTVCDLTFQNLQGVLNSG